MSAHELIVATRERLESSPESFSLPLGLIESSSHDQLLTLAAIYLLWVIRREQVSPEVALRRLHGDYLLSTILRAAAAREMEERS